MSEVDMGVEQPKVPASDAIAETDSSTVEVDAEDTETSAEPDQDSPKRTPWFQKRIDEVTAEKWELKRERDQLREMLQRQMQPQPEPATQAVRTDGRPVLENFTSYEEFTEALTDWKLDQRDAAREQRQQAETAAQAVARQEAEFSDRVRKAAVDKPDILRIVSDDTLPVSPAMAEVIKASDIGPQILAALDADRESARRIYELPSHLAGIELGRLAASASAPAQPRRINQPPPPINTPLAGGTAVTTDPARMSDAQFAAWRKAQIAQRR